ncbi:hypothetical protein MAR_002565 [Mya arenaria]|uniref:Uncharacterized protein n=1 Tax=Mya arenaria TaxID=6604 RepID=A0ABY7G503_MYAAR|nr:hypothetical protein MAR_002565 [Mya arenaria]
MGVPFGSMTYSLLCLLTQTICTIFLPGPASRGELHRWINVAIDSALFRLSAIFSTSEEETKRFSAQLLEIEENRKSNAYTKTNFLSSANNFRRLKRKYPT